MREINVSVVENTVYELFKSACCEIGKDVLGLLNDSLQREESPFGKEINTSHGSASLSRKKLPGWSNSLISSFLNL